MVITIPNSMVLANFMINFTTAAEDTTHPFMLNTTITLGYEVPWRKVHEVLINAASDIEDILDEPEPFVLQTALNDFYVSYEINAYTRLVSDIAIEKAYSQLHQNI
jgi:small-conductance mechanosensitive channel